MRAVSVLAVAEPGVWAELATLADLEPHLGASLDPLRRIALPTFERVLLPRLAERGLAPLIRNARHSPTPAERDDVAARVDALPAHARRVLRAAWQHAFDDVVYGIHAWDPEHDADAVRALHGAGLILLVPGDEAFTGRYRLHPDLPPPPPITYDLTDAAMDETDDLPDATAAPLALLHDMASLAAGIEATAPRRTHAGTLAKADARALGDRLRGDPDDPRWARALRGLEALGVVSMDPIDRVLHLDLGLEATLSGDAADALDHLVHRLVEPDLHAAVPAVREALRCAGQGAVDEVVFLELLREQHRDVIFPAWLRDGVRVYPMLPGEAGRPYDDDAFDAVEGKLIRNLLARLDRLGLVRRAPGVFAASPDGRVWARVVAPHTPPVWVSGDLEVLVPPHAITPWERFQVERLGRCLARDVVDRYKLERASLHTWLSTHDVDEALGLLARRCPAVPHTVVDTLRTWARSAERVVLTRGVIVP